MKKILLITLLICSTLTQAQNTFQKATSGAYIYSGQQTTDGGYVMVGDDIASGGTVLVKTDANGDSLWTKTYQAPNYHFSSSSVNTTKDGGYIILTSKDTAANAISSLDICLIKTNNIGVVKWTKIYKNAGATTVQQTADGGYVLGGNISNYGAGNSDIYVLKTDSAGSIQWTKTYGTIYADNLQSLQQTHDNGYIICGLLNGTNTLIKTNALGDTSWVKTYNSTTPSNNALQINTCAQTADGGYITCGRFLTANQTEGDAFYLKTNASGNVNWIKSMSISCPTCNNVSYSIANILPTSDKGYVFLTQANLLAAPSSSSQTYTMYKTDSLGNGIWYSLKDVTSESNYTLFQTADGGYATLKEGSNYYFLTKTDPTGNTACKSSVASAAGSAITAAASSVPLMVSSGGTSLNFAVQQVASTITYTTTCANVSGIKQNSYANSINLYPNPAQNNFTIVIDNNDKQTLQLFNINGQQVLTQTLQGTTSINISNLSAGVYNLSLTSSAGVANKRLIIVK